MGGVGMVKIVGPIRDLIPEWTDPDTGEVLPEHYVRVIFAEAVGSDGNVHMYSFTAGDMAGEHPELLEHMKAQAASCLESDMRSKGVWVDGDLQQEV